MALTRVAVSDDDGTGTTGTIWNAAQRNADFDIIDGRWTPITITATGTQNNLSITTGGVEADFIIFNNASDLTVTGFAAPSSPLKPGKPLRYVCIGAGNVFFAHQNGSSTAANRLINIATSANTPHSIGGGGMLTYDGGATTRWRLVLHEQGAWITPTFDGTKFTSSGGTWTVDSGDVAEFKYKLSGRSLEVRWNLSTTTVGAGTTTNLNIANAQFGSFTTAATAQYGSHDYSDNAGTHALGRCFALSSVITLQKVDLSNWSVSTNATITFGRITMEVA